MISRVPTYLDEADRKDDSFARASAELCLFILIFCCVTMVRIDSASKELSIGCHIVHFQYFDSSGENLAAEPNLALPITF